MLRVYLCMMVLATVNKDTYHVLRGRDNVVRIFIHAPRDYRVRKVMEMYGDTEQEGRKSIARSDAAWMANS